MSQKATAQEPVHYHLRERMGWVEQDHWVFDDEKVVGVHGG